MRNTRRRMNRLEERLRNQTHDRFSVPAHEVLADKGESERRLIRLLRHRRMEAITEKLRQSLMGDTYVPTWDASKEDRQQWYNTVKEMAEALDEELGDGEALQAETAKEEAELLARRRKAEAKTGRPVAFLLPFPVAALSERLARGRPNPAYDPYAFATELTPVYADASNGDPGLYHILGPF